MVPVRNQSLTEDELYDLMQKVARDSFIKIESVSTGLTQGIDLGSRNLKPLSSQK